VTNALDGLTDTQREAVTDRRSPLLVVAGPGAGKTEVLIRRVCWCAEQGLAPHRPLLIAREDAAATLLCERIDALIDGPHEALSVHSMQGLCARLIAEQAAAAGVEELTPVASAAERLAMLLERAPQLELRHHDFRGRPLALFAAFIRQIDRLKAALIDAERYTAWAGAQGEREHEFAALFAAHDRMLSERGLLDEGGLLIAAVRLLERDGAVASVVAEQHRELLVDDWQSRSIGERELVRLIAAGGAALTLAGDDDQASRAGAGSVAAFAAANPGAAVIALTHSFRCPERVLTGARAMLGKAPEDDAAHEFRGRPGGDLRFWSCASDRAQAQHVAAEIERLLAGGAVPAARDDETGPKAPPPPRCVVLVRSVASDGRAVAAALAERGVAWRMIGADAFFERAEIRDVLAWLRLLVDPRDAAAVVRALSRAPIGLHSADVARCVQIARRRKIDMVAGLGVALESPQVVPEARERIARFLAIHRDASAALHDERADLFVYRLIERLGLRRQHLFSAHADVAERLVNLAKFGELAARHARVVPSATPAEFAAYIAIVAESGIGEPEAEAVAPAAPSVLIAPIASVGGLEFDHVFALSLDADRMPGLRRPGAPSANPLEAETDEEHDAVMRRVLFGAVTRAREAVVLSYVANSGAPEPSPFVEQARLAVESEWERFEEEMFGPAEALHSLFRERRDELLESVSRVGARLGELRFDTDLDVAHGVVRLLELIKLSALLDRPEEQPLAEALADINSRLGAAATPLQREILLSSPLDELLAGTDQDGRRAARSTAHEEPSLAPFLPRRGEGLVLSASDIDTYRACPLRYKFARVLRVPREPTLNQRFGIAVHQVLERFHEHGTLPLALGGIDNGESARTGGILRLLDVAWRRGGFGDSDEERQLRDKARVALLRYEERASGDDGAANGLVADAGSEAGTGTPRWFERSFSFPLGAHWVRGRVDRVDELPGGGHELIDYKTGLPRQASQLREDVQLALYALAARETWQIEATERTYYYVLDDQRVSVGLDEARVGWISDTVAEVGAGILALSFEPTPSRPVCAMCDYRIACPAAEK
jgi:DNA helicase-2/ATP-dependent DNA helicase PcrA